jgi:hypothetical protein
MNRCVIANDPCIGLLVSLTRDLGSQLKRGVTEETLLAQPERTDVCQFDDVSLEAAVNSLERTRLLVRASLLVRPLLILRATVSRRACMRVTQVSEWKQLFSTVSLL